MAINAPDSIGFTDLGGSSITPRDTYARPAIKDPGNALGELAKAAEFMGVKVAGIATKQTEANDALEHKKIDYYVGQVRSSIKEGQPVDAQIGSLLPQQVPAIRAEVSRRLGVEAGQKWIADQMSPVLQDPRSLTDPNFVRDSFAHIKEQAATMYKGDPFYGGGFSEGLNATADKLSSDADDRQAGFYKGNAETNLAADAIQGATQAKSDPSNIGWHTVGRDGVDNFPNLKQAMAGNGNSEGTAAVANLNADFARKLDAFFGAAKEAGVNPGYTSGYRGIEHQAHLREKKEAEVRGQHPDWTPAQVSRAAGRWVASPGGSMHNFGEAMDLADESHKGDLKAFANTPFAKWAHANADKFGLYFPLGNEPWHVEMVGGMRQGNPNHRTNYPAADTEEPVGGGPSVAERIINAESGNNPYAQNPNSSAGGLGQFVDSTWIQMAKNTDPSLSNAPDGYILSLKKKSDPDGIAFQKKVLDTFTNLNAGELQKAGIEATPDAIYASHTLGSGTAIKVYQAADNVPLKQLVGAKAMSVNPQWSGMTVGEYKQWASKKMGQPVSAAVAGQNNIRRTDYQYSKTMPLDSLVRRDVYAKSLIQAASATLDPSYLDQMPPEYLTPQTQFAFQAARKQIADAQYAEQQRQHTISEQDREARIRGAEQKVNDYVAQHGKPPPLSEFIGAEPEVFQHVRSLLNKDYSVDPSEAVANRVKLEHQFTAAAIDPQYWKNINPEWTSEPSFDQKVDYIRQHPGLNSKETTDMLEKLPKIAQIGNTVVSPEAKEQYTTFISGAVESLKEQDRDAAKDDISLTKKPTMDWDYQARTAFNVTVKSGVKAYMAANNGQVPEDMTPIYDNATKVALSHLKLLNETRKAAKGDLPKTTSISGEDEKTVNKVLDAEQHGGLDWVKGPDGVYRLHGELSGGTPAYINNKPGEDNVVSSGAKIGTNGNITPEQQKLVEDTHKEGPGGATLYKVQRFNGLRMFQNWVPIEQLTEAEREALGVPAAHKHPQIVPNKAPEEPMVTNIIP